MGVLLVHFGFSQDEIGDFEYFLFLANGVSFFWSIGLLNGMKSFFPALSSDKQRSLLFGVALLFVLLAIFCFGGLSVYSSVRTADLSVPMGLLGAYLIFAIPSSLSEHILILRDRSALILWYGIASYLTYLIGIWWIVYIGGEVAELFIFLVGWSSARFLVLLVLLRSYAEWKIESDLIRQFMIFCAPLIAQVLLGSGMEYVDGFLVDHYFDRSEFAIFRYGARELPISTVLISAMASTMIPLAVVQLAESMADIKRRLTTIMHWLFPLSAILILLSRPLFETLYGDEFLDSAVVFSIYLLIICSRILLPQVILYARHENKAMMFVAFIELAVNISLSLVLMSYYGLYGIAAATVIAYLVQKSLLVAIVKYRHGISLGSYINLPLYGIYVVGLYLVFAISFLLF